mgnify:CR=1 FL=1
MRKFVVAIMALLLIFSFAAFPMSIANLSAKPTVAVKNFLSASASPLGGPPPGHGPKPKPPPGPAPNKWALVIGISKYANPSANLYNPDKDAKEMVKALETLYGFAEENIKLLTNNKATADNIVASITWLIDNENETSIVVFFYCGHGGQVDETETEKYGYPIDPEADGMDEYIVTYDLYGIPDDYLKDKFSAIESNQFFLWFGSCHSGGMSPDLNGDGRVIVAACQEEEVAWDYLLLHNTLFGYYYVDEGMLDKLCDADGDGIVTVEEAFYYAAPLVTAQEPEQHPFIWDSDTTSDLYL